MRLQDVSRLVDDRPKDRVFRVHRDLFADPELFELEQELIFKRTWSFLALESQLPNRHDFLTTHIARAPVLVTRDAAGDIGAFLNACRHKGAIVCPFERGNTKVHVCPYHGWAYDSAGRNKAIKDCGAGVYPANFDADDHDLVPLARVESYNGFVFGSLSPDVPPLKEFLGDFALFLDLVMQQGATGMELVPGRMVSTFQGNWKLMLDNALDTYHLTATHGSLLKVQAHRFAGSHQTARPLERSKPGSQRTGLFNFPHGHSVVWLDVEPEKRPLYSSLDEIRARVGDQHAQWMLKIRNITVFPNMQITEGATLMLRTFRPISVDQTEMRSYCLAPIGEASELRSWRLRQFEDVFSPSGLATADDTSVFERVQEGLGADNLPWLQGYTRGISLIEQGANDAARELGIQPSESALGVFETHSEACSHAQYREWVRLIRAGLEGRRAYP